MNHMRVSHSNGATHDMFHSWCCTSIGPKLEVMSEQDTYQRLGALADQQLKLSHESRRQFILRIGASENTVSDFIKGKRIPTTRILRAVAEGLEWDWSKVTQAIASDSDPADLELTDLQSDPWTSASTSTVSSEIFDASDDALLVELTRRLADRNATIRELQARLQNAQSAPDDAEPGLPPNVYDLAADKDRSGHGRAIRDEIDSAGEESQDS